jgi:hypothetical protein
VAVVKVVSTSPAVKIRRARLSRQNRGVVVEDIEDLDLGSVGEPVVGDVELPALVGGVGDKALPTGFRPLVRLWGDEAAGGKDPPDRRHCRGVALTLLQMCRDGGRAGLMAMTVEVFAQGDDLVLGRLRGAAGAVVGSA